MIDLENLIQQNKAALAILKFEKDLSENYSHYFYLLQGSLKDCRQIAMDETISKEIRIKNIIDWMDNLNQYLPEIVKV